MADDTHFNAVVVGSGFGGSVMAYRLAEAGLRVCVLERGKAYPPNSFPRSPHLMKRNFWDPSEGLYGMFNLWSFSGIGAIVSSGLGGGSLIYANVLLRKDEKWFVKEDLGNGGYEYWPVTRADLDPHYDRVERMMDAQSYPFAYEPYSRTSKTKALRFAAEKLNLEWQLPPLAITFANHGEAPMTGEPIKERPNIHNRTRHTCRLCGECDVGCNYGSKNTLDYNYLTEASRYGALIRTLCEVRSFTPRDSGTGGYEVRFVEHDLAREGERLNTGKLPIETLTCDYLILAAGALGTPFLMLKNRVALPGVSSRLGTQFCGNGDLLTLAVKSHETTDGVRKPRVLDPSHGPVITSAIRIPDALDGGQGRGFYVEDAGYPEFINWLLEASQAPGALGRAWHFGLRYLRGLLGLTNNTRLEADISRLFGETALSAGSLPLLGMGRDIPNGLMSLRGDHLDVDWRIAASKPYFDRVRATMQSIVRTLDAKFVDNVIWHLNRVVTVHPLGGCPMGRSSAEGVVNSFGEVFDHPGLYIVDGSVMPGPVGANPSLTIAALADRFADALIAKHGRSARH